MRIKVKSYLEELGETKGTLLLKLTCEIKWKLDSSYVADLAEKTSLLEQDGEAVQFVLLDDVPGHLRDKMVKVK